MNAHPKPQPSLYQQLEDLPEGLIGELLNGRLYTRPRPSGPHGLAGSVLGMKLGPPFHFADNGPGGWWIIDEPELHFIRNTEVDVPDLAGWRRSRLPRIPKDHRYMVAPDWVCEVLSPSTEKKDREVKMPIYAQYGVAFAWLVDPVAHTLEADALESGAWREIGRFAGGAPVAVAPFEAVMIRLDDLWAPT